MGSQSYTDILIPRRNEISNFVWTSKKIDAAVSYKQTIRPTPENHKIAVLQDTVIQELLDKISKEKNISKDILQEQIRSLLDEIGYDRNFKVIRWLAYVLIKICLRVSQGVYVNNNILNEKKCWGNCPIIFVPSHRSYADFILMSYVCYTYDVEIPAIAAGMDFHGMWAMGSMLRDTGAFFMRRSFSNDQIYWTTFKQYVSQLVTNGDVPIEFFIEGTRSRSNKSLAPKYGLLNMILNPLFLKKVPDILFVPINISYERLLEEKLFSFELLGVPKPKESTSGFFKSLSIIKESFGSTHVTLGEPISGNEFFQDYLDNLRNSIGPIHHKELTDNDKKIIPKLAYRIIGSQQKLAVLYTINLIALLVNYKLANSKTLMSFDELKTNVKWLKLILGEFGANIWSTNIENDIENAFSTHKNLIRQTETKEIDIVRNIINMENLKISSFKAHRLSADVMHYSVPFVTLQLYTNPVLHYLIDAALIVSILRTRNNIELEALFERYEFLKNLFTYEFVSYTPNIPLEFKETLNRCLNLSLIRTNGLYALGNNEKLEAILISSVQPFFYSYGVLINLLEKFDRCQEKIILIEAQKKVVDDMEQKFVHPYSLNLDSLSNCLSSLSSTGDLNRVRSDSGFVYEVIKGKLHLTKASLGNSQVSLYSVITNYLPEPFTMNIPDFNCST